VGTGRYGLNTIKDKEERRACMGRIEASMNAFKEWSCAVFSGDRPSDLKMQSAKTFDGTRQRVHEFLGYVYHYKNVSRPSLEAYLDGAHFADFMAYLKARNLDKAGHLKVRKLGESGVGAWNPGCWSLESKMKCTGILAESVP
jgi:hypothetical protein